MTFPEKADIEFFKEAKRIQELWEPQRGDFYIARRRSGDEVKIVISNRRAKEFNISSRHYEKTWLPRQGQLQEMLEERGLPIRLWIGGGISIAWAGGVESRGPTPSIALGRALIEVLKGKEE